MAAINGIEAVELLTSADPAAAQSAAYRGRKAIVERTADQPLTINGIEGVIFADETGGPGTAYRLDSADPLLAYQARQRGQRPLVVIDATGVVVPDDWWLDDDYSYLAAVMDFNNDRYALPEMGSELVTNGDFAANITGWTNANGASWSAGVLRLTASGAQGNAYQLVTTEVGKLYRLGYDIVAVGGGATQVILAASTTTSTAQAITSASGQAVGANLAAYFTATTTTTYILARTALSTASHTGDFDNISVKEVILTPTGRTYGSELVVNGDFATGPTYGAELLDNGTFSTGGGADPALNWVLKTPAVGTETMTISGGTLNLTGDGTNAAYADQSFVTTNGQTYEATFTTGTTSPSAWFGTGQGLNNILAQPAGGYAVSTTHVVRFVATGATTWVRFSKTSAGTGIVDNVSIKEFTQAAGWTLKVPNIGSEQSTISGGTLNLTGDGTNTAYADQSFTTVNQQVYELTFTQVNSTLLTIGTSQGGTQVLSSTITGPATAQTTTIKFVAGGTTTWIRFGRVIASLHTIDNVSIRALTAIGTYPKREATFDECFAYTAASDSARTYTDDGGVLRDMAYGRTNFVRNSSTTGAVVGSPGTMPTNWGGTVTAPLVRDVVGSGTADGLEYVDIRFSGTTGGAFTSLSFDGAIASPAFVAGVPASGSAYIALIAGSWTNTTQRSLVTRYNLNPSGSTDISTSISSATSTLTRFSTNGTPAGTLFGSGGHFILINHTSGVAVDFTLRVAAPQVEQASVATPYTRTTGTAITAGVNARRMTYANAKRQLRLENAGTNSLRNSTMVGAAVGTPGTIPTNWSKSTAGLEPNVVGLGTENGLAYIDLRFQGTPSVTTAQTLSFESGAIAASAAQVWTNTVYMKMVAGTVPASTFTLRAGDEGSGTNTTPDGTLRRYENIRTLASTVPNGKIRWNYADTVTPVDFTLRIAAPQCELNAFATDFIPTLGSAAVTRAIETARLSPLLEAVLQRAQGSVVVRGDLSTDTSAFPRLVGADVNHAFVRLSNNTTGLTFQAAANLSATIGSGSTRDAMGAAAAFDASGRSLVANGGTVATDANAGPNRTTIYLARGSTVAAGEYGDGYYDILGISPERLPATSLQTLAVPAT